MKDENIVKATCRELGITQKELGDMLDVPQPTVARWANGDIPKMAKMALQLMTENRNLKTKLDTIRKARDLINTL